MHRPDPTSIYDIIEGYSRRMPVLVHYVGDIHWETSKLTNAHKPNHANHGGVKVTSEPKKLKEATVHAPTAASSIQTTSQVTPHSSFPKLLQEWAPLTTQWAEELAAQEQEVGEDVCNAIHHMRVSGTIKRPKLLYFRMNF